MSQLVFDKLTAAPSAPSQGSVSVYMKTDGVLYAKNEDGVEYAIGVGSITNLSSIDYIDFDTTGGIANAVGRLAYNDEDGTLNLGVKGGNVTLQIGQEQLVRVVNKTISAFTEGQIIRIDGAQGNRLAANLARANTEVSSASTFAMVTETISSGSEGYATVSGLVRNINTSAFAEGAPLYLSPSISGGITDIKPLAPNHTVNIGWVVRSHTSVGSIFVNIQNGYELNELHDVLIDTPLDNDILIWDSTISLWKNVPKTSSITTLPTTTKFANYTISLADYTVRVDATSNSISITLPLATTNIGKIYVIKRIDNSNYTVNVLTTAGQMIDGTTSIAVTLQYQSLMFQSNGTSWDIL